MNLLSDLPLNSLINFGGRAWRLLNPAQSKLIAADSVANRHFQSANLEVGAIFRVSESSNIAHYLNNTFFDSFSVNEKSVIRSHSFNIGPRDQESTNSVECNIGLLTLSEFDWAFGKVSMPVYFWLSQTSGPNAFIASYYGSTHNTGMSALSHASGSAGVVPVLYLKHGLYVDNDFNIMSNKAPTLILATSDAKTLYENSVIEISGTAKDGDVGDVVMVKYSINGGTARSITSPISTGVDVPFYKALTFRSSKLFDGATEITATLGEGTQHVLKVWCEDDKGAKSAEQTRTFYVVPNRPASLTINPISQQIDLVDADKVNVSGNVSDPDSNVVSVKYKIANGSFSEVYNGTGGTFTFDVSLTHLTIGENILTVQATDSYGAVTQKTLKITKAQNSQPLKQAVTRYKLTPPNGTAKGVLLWIQREVGDLVVDAEISMTAAGAPEDFKPMTKSSTAFVRTGIEEDEFTFEHTESVANIILKVTMTRTSTASTQGITLISGVLS